MGKSDVPTPCPGCGYRISASTCERCGGRITNFEGTKTLEPGPGFFLADLIHGFVAFFAGALALINRKEFVGKLGLPVAVNLIVLLVVFVGFFWGLWELFEGMLDGDWAWFEFLKDWVSWLLPVLSLVLATVSMVLLSPVIIETVTGPFLEPLADVTEKIHGGAGMRAPERGFWESIVWGVRSSAQILLVQLLVLIPCLILSLSGIGAIIAMVIAAWLNALIWFEMPFSRRGYGLRARRQVLRRNWARALGFGLGFQVGMFIPIFNFVLLTPAAAVATSSLYFHLEKGLPGSTFRPPPAGDPS